MKKLIYGLVIVFICLSKPAMASYLYSFQGAPSTLWNINWSWEFSSASIISTPTELAGSMLSDQQTPVGYDIVKIAIDPTAGWLKWVSTYFDTTGDGEWDIGMGVGFDADIAQVGVFTRDSDLNTLSISVVPEPGSIALFCIAFAGLAASRRRRSC